MDCILSRFSRFSRFLIQVPVVFFAFNLPATSFAVDCRTSPSKCELVLTIREFFNRSPRSNLHEVYVELNESGGFQSLQYFKNRARWTDRVQGGVRVDEDGADFFEARTCTLSSLQQGCQLLVREGRRIVSIYSPVFDPHTAIGLDIHTTMWWFRPFEGRVRAEQDRVFQSRLVRRNGHWQFEDSEQRRFMEIEMWGRRATTGGGVSEIRPIY